MYFRPASTLNHVGRESCKVHKNEPLHPQFVGKGVSLLFSQVAMEIRAGNRAKGRKSSPNEPAMKHFYHAQTERITL